jgi:hypothetical protein
VPDEAGHPAVSLDGKRCNHDDATTIADHDDRRPRAGCIANRALPSGVPGPCLEWRTGAVRLKLPPETGDPIEIVVECYGDAGGGRDFRNSGVDGRLEDRLARLRQLH